MVDEDGPDLEAQHQRRPGTARTGPDRRSPAGESRASTEAESPGDVPGVIAHAVRLGYRVIEENLQHGRNAAEKLREQDYHFQDAGEDAEILVARLLTLARELSVSFFDLLAAFAEAPALRDALRGRPEDASAQRSKQPPTGASEVLVQIFGDVKATGEAQLGSLTGLRAPPQATPLRPVSASQAAPPIMGVRLGAAHATGAVAVNVPIPDGQPPGTYAGTIHDSASGRLLGSVSVTVHQP